jgi:hypothetical protein
VDKAAPVASHKRFFGGLFIGSHAVAEGWLSRKQLESGLYRRVLHNVYVDPSVVIDHQMRARAAALLMPPEAAIGGRSAAAWFGAPFANATEPVVVVAPRGCMWDGPQGVRVHTTDLRPSEVWTTEEGVRLTTALRTAWDIACREPTLTAVALLDGMLRHSDLHGGDVTARALSDEFDARRGRWGSRRAHFVLPLLDGRAMSPPESKVRVSCQLQGLPRPVPQYEVVEDGVFLGQVDLAWPEARLIVEYEGAYHFEAQQIVKDDARYERLVAAGWRVIRLSSADLHDLEDVVRRISEALAERSVVR